MGTSATRVLVAMAVCSAVLVACGGAPDIPDVVGEDLAFTRGAMASAELEYDVQEVEVSATDQDGVVQSAAFDDEASKVVIEVGALPTITITGTFTLVADPELDESRAGETCSGSGGYSDFGDGMNVTIRDGNGTIIATTSSRDTKWTSLDGVGGLWCRTSFESTADIVDFYEISIGRRGELSYSFDELEAVDFDVALTLGG